MTLIVLFMLLFVVLCAGNIIYGEPEVKPAKSDYMIEIATIQDTPSPRPASKPVVERPKSRPVRKPQAPKPKPEPTGKDHPLYEDCVLALVTLGENKASSKKVAASILSSEDITSVEQFLTVVYSKD